MLTDQNCPSREDFASGTFVADLANRLSKRADVVVLARKMRGDADREIVGNVIGPLWGEAR